MRRVILGALVVVCLLGCGGGLWLARGSAIAPVILPGATNVVVISQGFNSIRVEYRAAGQPYEWRGDIFRQLGGAGWRGLDYTFSGTRAPFIVTSYAHTIQLGPFTLIEHAVVGGDPDDGNVVIIQIHHELHLND
jgi:hypothetical protein